MKTNNSLTRLFPVIMLLFIFTVRPRVMAITLTNPVLFVTQVQMPKELNGNVSNTFVSVVSLFGNHLPDTTHAGRGGDLWLMTTNLGLVNLTRKAGFGTNGAQDKIGIGVRDPSMHWGGTKAIFSMVVGAPTNATDTTAFYWQLYELTNIDSIISDTNTKPAIVRVSNQPTNFNNVSPCYGTDGRIIFMTDKPITSVAQIYPSLEEYKGNPAVSGTWSLDPVTGDLRLLNHTPSGAFNPFVDSFGRIIETRWDHLVQDAMATDDRMRRATNGAFNYLSEATNAPISTNIFETFPEPRNYDSNSLSLFQVHGNSFNNFLPWMLPESGGAEEVLNHVGRHELFLSMTNSFTNDVNLLSFNSITGRTLAGVVTSNTNYLDNFFQIAEDPRHPGTYFGVDAPDFGQFGGTHTAGQIITLTGGQNVNPTNMVISYITPKPPTPLGIFRNPLPMSDGKLIAAYTAATSADTNFGSELFPDALYKFRLVSLVTNSSGSGLYTTNGFLTGGLTNLVTYWTPAGKVTQSNALWELQPVEVRSRIVPPSWNPGVAAIEQQTFTEEGVDLPTFQADLAARGMALVVSHNVTARDAADKQQPYNLRVPGGVLTTNNSGKIYDVTHLTFLQADYLRGYTNTSSGAPLGRRVLATPMHDTLTFNRPSSKANAPVGGSEIQAVDGSQATFVPANRALTWHLTGTNNNDSIVKERYWVTFRPGEVRTCANCHGINAKDQAGNPSPTNSSFALRLLLRQWRTNTSNAYSLTVSNGSGGGNFGAGSVLALTANVAPSGQWFAGWTGAGVSNAASTITFFIMPTNNATVTAVFTNLPSPSFTNAYFTAGGNTFNLTALAATNQPWVLETSSNLLDWLILTTNSSGTNGVIQFAPSFNLTNPRQFFRLRSP